MASLNRLIIDTLGDNYDAEATLRENVMRAHASMSLVGDRSGLRRLQAALRENGQGRLARQLGNVEPVVEGNVLRLDEAVAKLTSGGTAFWREYAVAVEDIDPDARLRTMYTEEQATHLAELREWAQSANTQEDFATRSREYDAVRERIFGIREERYPIDLDKRKLENIAPRARDLDWTPADDVAALKDRIGSGDGTVVTSRQSVDSMERQGRQADSARKAKVEANAKRRLDEALLGRADFSLGKNLNILDERRGSVANLGIPGAADPSVVAGLAQSLNIPEAEAAAFLAGQQTQAEPSGIVYVNDPRQALLSGEDKSLLDQFSRASGKDALALSEGAIATMADSQTPQGHTPDGWRQVESNDVHLALANMDDEDLAALQLQMAAAGLYGNGQPILGTYTGLDRSALDTILKDAEIMYRAGRRVTVEQLIQQRARQLQLQVTGSGSGGVSLSTGQGDVDLTDPEALRVIIDRESKSRLGRAASAQEQDAFINHVHGLERGQSPGGAGLTLTGGQAQASDYLTLAREILSGNFQQPGGTTQTNVSPAGQASTFVKDRNSTEATTYGVANHLHSVLKFLGAR